MTSVLLLEVPLSFQLLGDLHVFAEYYVATRSLSFVLLANEVLIKVSKFSSFLKDAECYTE